MAHIQTQDEWQEEMALKILTFVRDELYMDLRFMDIALSVLKPKADRVLKAFATDGAYLAYPPDDTIRLFRDNPAYLDRAYLHVVMHCIFGHLWIAGDRNRALWDISCDIAVEYTIDRIDKPCTRRILRLVRQELYKKLDAMTGVSAAIIYRMISGMTDAEIAHLKREFYTDDHCYWPRKRDGRMSEQQSRDMKRWQKIARQSAQKKLRQGDDAGEGEAILSAQLEVEKNKRNYREFLEQFTVLREEIGIDPDEFDLNYYTLGLRMYDNMPLIEPLESREIKKIQEFVIAIDTSYSTSSGLVEGFLKETFAILNNRNSFFREAKVRVIQCDDKVRMDTVIKSEAEISRLMKEFTIGGGGGTDFRPVFSYVNELIDAGEIKNCGGLIYFTDGMGIYPRTCPAYKCAFLYMEPLGAEEEALIPPWAIRYQLWKERDYEHKTSKG
jgi:predicted metal-dependent peptidase